MKVTSKRVVLVEMDRVDYEMLLDTLGEASKVRSKLYPSLNEKAAMLYGSITASDMNSPVEWRQIGGGDSDTSHD